MPELNDYSGDFQPDLKLEDMSKDFLLKLARHWQWSWMQLDSAWYDHVHDRFGIKTGFECDLNMWLRCAERCNTRYARIAGIPMKSAVDCLKALQLPIDNTMGALWPTESNIIDEHHVIITVIRCPALEWCEKSAPERIVPMCRWLEPKVIDKYKVSMDVSLNPTKLPPRQSQEEIACEWEYVTMYPEGPARSKDEVVNETTDIPEVDDQTGPYYPNLTLEDFSKGFLIKLLNAWQYGWLVMNEGYYFEAKARVGAEAAGEMELLAWNRMAEKVNRRYVKTANVELNTVLDSLKLLQLPMNNALGFFPARYDIKSPNHVVMTISKGEAPDYLEGARPERTPPMYHAGGQGVLEKYLVNPKIKVTPLRVPPRNSSDDVDCEWELKIES